MSAIDDFINEFVREGGFFFGLHQRHFDPAAAERALKALKRTKIGADHGANYRLIDLLFNAGVELSTYAYYNRDNEMFDHHFNLLFFEIAERFNSVSKLGDAMREK
ncbi:hypothetical protein [Mesorhizobium loti]|uniref:Uncharacterized protein n=1 Tax=Mesorhizobium loti R88b TaxID=935548 RepID=A0A6M7WZJ6_RHILI|nr:hypothetical protein [Mesorhizobium loti]QKD04551.1 hypothetical protein EB235_26215 [Mesorhizobium loti R88b]